MKEYEICKVTSMRIRRVICDDCKEECTNTHFEILSKASFSEKPDLIKDICWKCYDKQFADAVRGRHERDRIHNMELLKTLPEG